MENTINERVEEFIRHKKLTKRAFATAIGMDEGTLGNKIRGVTQLDINTIRSILLAFNELSAEWLVMGTGPMLKDTAVPAQVTAIGDNVQGENIKITKIEREYMNLLVEKDKQVTALIELLNKKNTNI